MKTWINCDYLTDNKKKEIKFLFSLCENVENNASMIEAIYKQKKYMYCCKKMLQYLNTHKNECFNKTSYCIITAFIKNNTEPKIKFLKTKGLVINKFYIKKSSYNPVSGYCIITNYVTVTLPKISLFSEGEYRLYKNKIYKLWET